MNFPSKGNMKKFGCKQKTIQIDPLMWRFYLTTFSKNQIVCNSAVNMHNILSIMKNFFFWTGSEKVGWGGAEIFSFTYGRKTSCTT